MPRQSQTLHTLKLACLIVLACMAIQQGSSLFEYLSAETVEFSESAPLEWTAHFRPGRTDSYFVSAGRPRASCDLLLNNAIVATNKGALPEIRDDLMLGVSFRATSDQEVVIKLKCTPQSGFSAALTHRPRILTETSGKLLHIWRTITQLIIGPTASLMLLVFLAFSRTASPSSSTQTNLRQSKSEFFAFIFFGIISLLYSISLAHYPRLFVSSLPASILHIELRHLFALSFVFLCGTYSRHVRSLWVAHLTLGLATICVALTTPALLQNFYKYHFILFISGTSIAVYYLHKVEPRSEAIVLLRSLATGWLLLQMLDFHSFFQLLSGENLGPSMVAIMAASVAYIGHKESLRKSRIHAATVSCLDIVESRTPVKEVLAQLAQIALSETHFSRVSAYIDSFCLGMSDSPRMTFQRIMEYGYTSKDTEQDDFIRITDGGGLHMKRAMDSASIVLSKSSKDNAFFMSIPIGSHACINLSDTAPRSSFSAYESEEVALRLLPALMTLDSRLLDLGIANSTSLARIRSKRGNGSWVDETGCIFVDINDYSRLTELHGRTFTDFISECYIPALVKDVGAIAAPEHIKGDEIYFVVLSDLMAVAMSVSDATLAAVSRVDLFVRGEGSALCESSGYFPITVSIGATVGRATITSDAIQVRTSGQIVNEAKRLQEAAGRAGVLVKGDFDTSHPPSGWTFGKEVPVLQKKNFILATALVRLSNLPKEVGSKGPSSLAEG